MSIAKSFLPEFDQEMEATRRVLERVPDGKADWKPHERSMPLGRLASHLAELPGWISVTLEQDEFDMAPPGADPYEPLILESTAENLKLFDENVRRGRELIAETADDRMMSNWSFKHAGRELFSAPKVGVLRRFVMNHVIHHRGQLTVYLRLLEVPVPQTLGPTADETDF